MSTEKEEEDVKAFIMDTMEADPYDGGQLECCEIGLGKTREVVGRLVAALVSKGAFTPQEIKELFKHIF